MDEFMLNLWKANQTYFYQTHLMSQLMNFIQAPVERYNKIQPYDERKNVLADLQAINPDLIIKHPLQHKWSLWFHKKDRRKAWEDNLEEIASFDTVEDFWSLYYHIESVGNLNTGSDISLFKHGIKPMWEDDKNKKGGRWLIYLSKPQRSTELEIFWLEMALCLIGEGFKENGEEICGAVVNIRRKGDKIALWTTDSKQTIPIIKIGRILKEKLNLPNEHVIGYQAHTDSMFKFGSIDQYSYTL